MWTFKYSSSHGARLRSWQEPEQELSMRYIKLGRTGLDVSPIALGCMTYGEPGRGYPSWSLAEDKARPLIKQAVEAGINFFDTANMYSQGSSEEILGRALKEFAEIDNSLRRLGMDYVDLYQVHRMDPATPIEETFEAFHDVVKSGKVRYL